jgi:branched-chain amino acid transport system substrate-binding protein
MMHDSTFTTVRRLSQRVGPALMIAVALLTAACHGRLPDKGQVVVGPDEPLVIGVVTTWSGAVAAEGQGIAQAARLAAEERPTVRGRPVRLEVRDGGCDPVAAEAAVTALLAEPRLIGVVGPICSPACVAVEPLIFQRAAVMVTPRCTDIAVTRQGYEGILRTAYTDALQAVAVGTLADELLRTRRVFLVHDGTIYGRGLRDVVKLVLGRRRLAGVVEVLPGSEDYGAVVRGIARSGAGLIFYAGYPEDATRLLAQLRAARVAVPVVLPDTALLPPGFVATAGAAADGVFVTEPVPLPGPDAAAFADRYHARFATAPEPFAAEAYDAVHLLLDAVERAAERRGDRLIVDRRRLREAAHRVDRIGASGRIRFLPHGDRVEGAAVRLWQVRDGQFVLVRVIDISEK